MKKWLMLPVLLLAVVLMGDSCVTDTTTSVPNAYQKDQAVVQKTQQAVQTSVPIPTISKSVERQNIADRAKLFDKQNVTTYIYLISFGKVMAFYPLKGKVSSLNSYLTPLDQLVFADGTQCNRHRLNGGQSADAYEPCYVVSSPDIDGAYGENSNGIFFFTTDGAYVEWKGDYMVSDQPLQLSTQPELIRTIK